MNHIKQLLCDAILKPYISTVDTAPWGDACPHAQYTRHLEAAHARMPSTHGTLRRHMPACPVHTAPLGGTCQHAQYTRHLEAAHSRMPRHLLSSTQVQNVTRHAAFYCWSYLGCHWRSPQSTNIWEALANSTDSRKITQTLTHMARYLCRGCSKCPNVLRATH